MKNYLIGKTVRARSGGVYVQCKCGGQVMVDAAGYRQTPVGFGWRGDKFVVDALRQRGWFGVCLKCQRDVFAPNRKARRVTQTPRAVNRKIKRARARMGAAGD